MGEVDVLTVGMDEVATSSLVGGFWVGAVLPSASLGELPLRDSKELSPQQIELLAREIGERAICAVAEVTLEEIDRFGLGDCLTLGYQRAFEVLRFQCDAFEQVIIDGKVNYLQHEPRVRTQVRADATVPSVAAASIVAKHAANMRMAVLAAKYPEYCLDQNHGHNTVQHRQALAAHGASAVHRRRSRVVQAQQWAHCGQLFPAEESMVTCGESEDEEV